MDLIVPLPDIISAIERVLPCCQESSHFLRRRNRRGGLPVLQNGLRVLQKFLADLGVLRLLFILRQSEGGFPAAADAAATALSLRATLFGWLAIAIAASVSVRANAFLSWHASLALRWSGEEMVNPDANM